MEPCPGCGRPITKTRGGGIWTDPAGRHHPYVLCDACARAVRFGNKAERKVILRNVEQALRPRPLH